MAGDEEETEALTAARWSASETEERLAHLVHQNHEDQYQDKLAQAEVAW